MVELYDNSLKFTFPDVHPNATVNLSFLRTLRIPDDGKTYPLPPGLDRFPLRHLEDHGDRVPESWRRRGGVLLPMYQNEALWIRFEGGGLDDDHAISSYPFAIKIAAGKINAITGKGWDAETLSAAPGQNYVAIPGQPWLDGFCVEKGKIRQFVAEPLGSGYSAEEQITGKAEFGGLQIQVFPMKRDEFERRYPVIEREREVVHAFASMSAQMGGVRPCRAYGSDMGLAPGGLMKQEIKKDRHPLDAYDTAETGRCFIHLVNSLAWRAITGEKPPLEPLTPKQYEAYRFPWFEFYDAEAKALEGSDTLAALKSITEMAKELGDPPIPDNESVPARRRVWLFQRETPRKVSEGSF